MTKEEASLVQCGDLLRVTATTVCDQTHHGNFLGSEAEVVEITRDHNGRLCFKLKLPLRRFWFLYSEVEFASPNNFAVTENGKLIHAQST